MEYRTIDELNLQNMEDASKCTGCSMTLYLRRSYYYAHVPLVEESERRRWWCTEDCATNWYYWQQKKRRTMMQQYYYIGSDDPRRSYRSAGDDPNFYDQMLCGNHRHGCDIEQLCLFDRQPLATHLYRGVWFCSQDCKTFMTERQIGLDQLRNLSTSVTNKGGQHE